MANKLIERWPEPTHADQEAAKQHYDNFGEQPSAQHLAISLAAHRTQAIAALTAERDAIVKMLTDRMNAYEEHGDHDEMLALKYSIAAIERGDHKGDPANG